MSESPNTLMTGDDERQPKRATLAALLRPERPRLTAAAVLAVLSTATVVLGPSLLGHATDILFDGVIGKLLPTGMSKAQAIAALRSRGQGHLADMLAAMDVHPGVGVDLARYSRILALVAVLYVFGALFTWIQARLLTGIAQRTVYRMRQAAEDKLARLPLRYFDTHAHGEILSRVVNDVDNVDTTLSESLNQLPGSVLSVLGTLAVMFWISPLLATASLLTIPVVVAATAVIARRSKAGFDAQWEQTGQLTATVEETYAGHALVLAYGRRQQTADGFENQNRQLRRATFSAQFFSGAVFPVVVFVGSVNYVLIAGLGGYRVATGLMTLGAVQAFIQYSQRFTSPVIQIASQMNVVQSGFVSARRVLEFLDAPEEPALPSRSTGPAPRGNHVRLEAVSFRYEPDTPLIEDLTLDVAHGQTVAIVGPTGAGKTTLVNLLVRFYEIDAGRILLDGVDYRDLSRDQVRSCFSMVPQDTWLFRGTIRENIAYGKEGAREEEILAAARAAHVEEFVRTLPDGYDTMLDGEASAISTGQKQLLTIARAVLADPGILILDEATSNVDTRTEALIQAAMAALRRGRTSFVIAHRLSTIQSADTIIVMDHGRVVEQGTHEELLDRAGLYHDLHHSQFSQTHA